mmetsp:Transcript_53857/g.62978  ORF Transcript_53857/g.62978 Transcript_53857/m.62978 type:complete len:92 (-) Transcript_53857:29-304(-)
MHNNESILGDERRGTHNRAVHRCYCEELRGGVSILNRSFEPTDFYLELSSESFLRQKFSSSAQIRLNWHQLYERKKHTILLSTIWDKTGKI